MPGRSTVYRRYARFASGQRLANGEPVPEGLQYFAKAITRMRQVGGASDVRATMLELEMLSLHSDEIADEEAQRIIAHAHQLLESAGGRLSANVTTMADVFIGEALLNRGDVAAARDLLERASTAIDGRPEQPRERESRLRNLGLVRMFAGDHRSADTLLRGLFEDLRRGHPKVVPYDSYGDIVRNLVWGGDLQAAGDMAAQAPAIDGRDLNDRDRMEGLEEAIADFELASGKPERATARLAPFVLNASTAAAEAFHPQARTIRVMGAASCAKGDATGGAALLAKYLDRATDHHLAIDPEMALARVQLGFCLLGTGDVRGARNLAAQAREALVAQPAVSDYFKKPLADLEQALQATDPRQASRKKVT